MENSTVILTFHPDTNELDIDAPALQLDFALSLIERAKRILETQEKILVAQQISQSVRAVAMSEQRTEKVMSRIKM